MMADPFSLIAGIMSIATVAVKSSRALLKLVDNIKEAFKETRAIARDVHAFQISVVSLRTALQEEHVQDAVSSDVALSEMIGSL